jgi:hypothetical protein
MRDEDPRPEGGGARVLTCGANSSSKLGYVLERLGTLGTLGTLRTLGIRRIGRLSWAFDDLFVL